ncbi:hypothetical protein WJX84_008623 [Apatococcus fuscideae]|uniref:Uncharacterized protein n=1 Tax=Apatococcus fuscideae TaxID=2026836 RepID=A0AAW1T2A3_9CHLO
MASPPHIIRQSLGQPEANLSRDEWKLTEQDFCGRQHTKVCSLEPSNERDAIQEGQQLSEGPEATSTDALEDQAPQEQEVHVTESVRHAREQAEIRMKAIFQMIDNAMHDGQSYLEQVQNKFVEELQGLKRNIAKKLQSDFEEWLEISLDTIQMRERVRHTQEAVQFLAGQIVI